MLKTSGTPDLYVRQKQFVYFIFFGFQIGKKLTSILLFYFNLVNCINNSKIHNISMDQNSQLLIVIISLIFPFGKHQCSQQLFVQTFFHDT